VRHTYPLPGRPGYAVFPGNAGQARFPGQASGTLWPGGATLAHGPRSTWLAGIALRPSQANAATGTNFAAEAPRTGQASLAGKAVLATLPFHTGCSVPSLGALVALLPGAARIAGESRGTDLALQTDNSFKYI
jgi:hypothetical protein